MSPKRGDRVAPPAGPGQWELRFSTSEAAKGWDWLCRQAAANTETVWRELRTRPEHPVPTTRHHRLKGRLASAAHSGVEMEQWQYEVTGGGRIWYLVDVRKHTLWVRHAGSGHPRQTD